MPNGMTLHQIFISFQSRKRFYVNLQLRSQQQHFQRLLPFERTFPVVEVLPAPPVPLQTGPVQLVLGHGSADEQVLLTYNNYFILIARGTQKVTDFKDDANVT